MTVPTGVIGVFALLLLSIGILFCVLGGKFRRREIPPNHIAGLRTRRLLRNPDLWYSVHEVVGWDMQVAGAVMCLLALISFPLLLAIDPSSVGLTQVIALVVLPVASTIRSLNR